MSHNNPRGSSLRSSWFLSLEQITQTFVSVKNTGFSGDPDQIVKQAIDSTEGFTLVLAGLKALLEHNIVLNLGLYHKGISRRLTRITQRG